MEVPAQKPVVVVENETLMCPITQCMLRDPVISEAGHTYERSAIETHLARSNKDPVTRMELVTKALVPNILARAQVQKFLEDHPDHVPAGWVDRGVPPIFPTSVTKKTTQPPPARQNPYPLPTRPKSSYFLFCDDVRPRFRRDFPGAGMADISRMMSQAWNALDESDKNRYVELARSAPAAVATATPAAESEESSESSESESE